MATTLQQASWALDVDPYPSENDIHVTTVTPFILAHLQMIM
jgi:hypothetical protein